MAEKGIDLLVTNGQVITCDDKGSPVAGSDMGELDVIQKGWVAINDGVIVAVGTESEVVSQIDVTSATQVIDATGKVVTPGLIDPHTHFVFGGSREDEFFLRAQGADYMEIMDAGGGILSTVRATRQATLEELIESGHKRLKWMLSCGVTTVESKSGYGLDVETEIKQLQAMNTLQELQHVEIVPTFLGAHAWPEDYRNRQDDYIKLVVDEMLPEVKKQELAEYCDVFCETGVFSLEQTRIIFAKAIELGFKLRLHADEMSALGGAQLAAEFGAASADHLLMVSEQGIEALSSSGVLPILLPATAFTLQKPYAPAREMINRGLPIALATDFNPGSSPTANLPLTMAIACLYMGLSAEEAFYAVTINAAHSLGRADKIGSLDEGKQADVVIFDVDHYAKIPYYYGVNLVETVIKKGEIVL